jgi:uncharacterized phage protein gp47/JayE
MADEYGVTQTGFKSKSRDQIVADLNTAAKNIFGEGVNLASNSPLGILIGLISWPLSLVWNGLEGVYNSQYVDTAGDQSLDNVCKYIGIRRRPATKAIQVLRFTGMKDTEIPINYVVETKGDTPIGFATLAAGTIPEDPGYIELQAECQTAGAVGNVPFGTVSETKSPISGLSEVSNQSLLSTGLDRETDLELRARYRRSVARGGASTIDSIIAAILDVTGVLDAVVIENDKSVADAQGRPPHSIEVIVLGGQDADIARAIFDSKAAGIEPVGTQSYNVADLSGVVHPVKFNRAEQVNVYVSIAVTVSAFYPVDGDAQIKDQVISYIGGFDSDDVFQRGLMMGASVVYMKIPDLVFNVPGVDDVTITIGTAPTPTGTANITLDYDQKAVTDTDKVVVTSA